MKGGRIASILASERVAYVCSALTAAHQQRCQEKSTGISPVFSAAALRVLRGRREHAPGSRCILKKNWKADARASQSDSKHARVSMHNSGPTLALETSSLEHSTVVALLLTAEEAECLRPRADPPGQAVAIWAGEARRDPSFSTALHADTRDVCDTGCFRVYLHVSDFLGGARTSPCSA